MTATCPLALRPEVLSTLGIDDDCHVIHAPTDRPEISYNVKIHPTLDEAKQKLVEAVQGWLEKKKNSTSFRGLVYCRSTDAVDELARLIGCKPFHAGRPEEERKASFQDWVDGKQKFMVCSSLMGCGVDVEGVAVVFHYGTPWSVLDFAQESGRAGRGGKPSLSFVYAGRDERQPAESDDENLYGAVTMREWVLQTHMCRRIALSSFLDNRRTTCTLLKGAVPCDVCNAKSLEPHPGRLVPFSTWTIRTGDIPKPRPLPTIPPSSLEYAVSISQRQEDTRLVAFQTPTRLLPLSLMKNKPEDRH